MSRARREVTPCGLFFVPLRMKEEEIMTEPTATVFSNQAGITTRACPRGHVYLQVAHTCLALRKEDFLALAHVVKATKQRLLVDQHTSPQETRH